MLISQIYEYKLQGRRKTMVFMEQEKPLQYVVYIMRNIVHSGIVVYTTWETISSSLDLFKISQEK